VKSTLALAFLFVAGFIALLLLFAAINDRWDKRASTGNEKFFSTLHLLAVVVALIGMGVAGVSFANGDPDKWLHLLLPPFFVVLVYAFALPFNGGAWVLLARDLASRFRGKD
jgi:hypothetical protein